MKALTLTQPWATLVALGAKRIETRSWGTPYRGPLAIHAAKGLGPVGGYSGLISLCYGEPFRGALGAAGFAPGRGGRELPLGQVVAVCQLVDCIRADRALQLDLVSEREAEFGDFRTGRWAWLLEDVRALPEPIPARGTLGLWEWEPPVGVHGEL